MTLPLDTYILVFSSASDGKGERIVVAPVTAGNVVNYYNSTFS